MTDLETHVAAALVEAAQRRASATRALSSCAYDVIDMCLALAEAFRRGATLFVAGTGQAVADAQHVAVEFVHPVVVGKPALPAISLADDPALLTDALVAGDPAAMFTRQLEALTAPGDVLLAISPGRPDAAVSAALGTARAAGLRTMLVAGAGAGPGAVAPADHVVVTGTADSRLAKEADVTAYHLLWEITHVALEHGDIVAVPACADEVCITCSDQGDPAQVLRLLDDDLAVVEMGGAEATVSVGLVDAAVGTTVLVHAGEAIAVVPEVGGQPGHQVDDGFGALYPFLAPAPVPGADGLAALREDLLASTRRKIEEAAALRESCIRSYAGPLVACARAVADRVRAGGRLLVFGNGGSSTDAQSLAGLFLRSPDGARPVPAIALTAGVATLTALGNDVGFDVVFSRQVASMGRDHDVAVALSTSGNSANLVRALDEARRRGLLTVGFAGNDGGQMAHAQAAGHLDHLFVVPSVSIHRIQEAQASLYDLLWELTQRELATHAGEVPRT